MEPGKTTLIIPRQEVDTFAVSAILNDAIFLQYTTRTLADAFKRYASQLSSRLLAGETVLTIDDNGEYVYAKLADEPEETTK